jgi:hypothetical protein
MFEATTRIIRGLISKDRPKEKKKNNDIPLLMDY